MKRDRHAVVGVSCAVCSTPFLARKERVEKGMGRYCSEDCYNDDQREKAKQLWGRKDLAKRYKIGGRYCARWYDENGKTRSTSYHRWWWEMNVGEIPEGMIVLYKDNNPMNIDPSNFELGTKLDSTNKAKKTLRNNPKKWEAYLEKNRQRMEGFKHTKESKKRLSESHTGKKLTLEHRLNISRANERKWDNGLFDNIHKGKNNWNWKGGVPREYPLEFNKSLKDFVKSRDNFQCQICGDDLYQSPNARVHHRDGSKLNNNPINLLLLCKPCHGKVHSKKQQSPPIMALREELY